MKSDEIFETIGRYHSELSRLGVSRLGLFGSAVRNETRPFRLSLDGLKKDRRDLMFHEETKVRTRSLTNPV